MKLVLATRRSKLALAQARAYAASLVSAHPGLEIEELHIVTTGDRIQDRSLQDIGGKGLFVKEIEEALLEGRADLAVHSIKDMPAALAEGLVFGAIPPREDPRDALVAHAGGGLAALKRGATVGTSSLRRSCQLLAVRPDLRVVPLRGNVDTRLRKVAEAEVDAIVLALAGLRRMSLTECVTEVLATETMLPAVGQGALGIECRADDERTLSLLRATDDLATRIAVTAERAFMRAVGGSCQLPLAALCERRDSELHLRAMLAEPDGSRARFDQRHAPLPADETEALATADALGLLLGAALA